MPNILDANGLQVNTADELLTLWTTRYQQIYGADVNLESDSPDGQMMRLKIQDTLDLQDLLVQIYSTFSPDNAVGVVLDQRVAINGIQRHGGTYTETPITLVTNRSANFYGIDQATFAANGDQLTGQPIYTVSDNAGNQFWLMTSQLGLAAGTHNLTFRAKLPGQVLTIPNTINVPVTVVQGVVSINNPSVYSVLGENEESDAALKIRRQQSVSQAAQGFIQALKAALENLTGMNSANVFENNTSTTDSDGIPGHSIWVVTDGNSTDADIADTINRKRNEGCGMFGEKSYIVTLPDGQPFPVFWDEAQSRAVFIHLVVTPIDGVTPVNYQGILDQLPALIVAEPNQTLNTTQIGTLVQGIDPNCNVTEPGLSTAETQEFLFSGVASTGQFNINYNGNETSLLNYSDDAATIQAALELLPGLSGILVSGSIASQLLSFDLSNVPTGPQALLFVTNSTLDVSVTYDESFTPLLVPSSKRYKFAATAAGIVLLPVILLPATNAVGVNETIQFEGHGGYRTLHYSVVSSIGSTIDPVTGLYTAGASAGSDTVRVDDDSGNFATASVTVA